MSKENNEKNLFGLSDFFSSLFHNLPKLLLTNLLFAVPFAVFFLLFWWLNKLTGVDSMFFLFLTAIPLFPFYAGVTQVTSHMVRGEEDVDVLQNFLSGVKENFWRFLIYGVLFYFAIVLSYYSVVMYSTMGAKQHGFYVLLAMCVIIIIFLLFVFYYVAPMSVTFDLSLKNVLKNSALMTFGEIKHNLIATFGLFVLALVCATVLFCCPSSTAVIIATAVLMLVFVPSIMSFVINSAVYMPMYTMITGKAQKAEDIDKKIENRKKGIFNDDEDKSDKIIETFDGVEVDESKDGDEYIFYNGKMVKRSVLIKMKKDAENAENTNNDNKEEN